MPLFYHLTYMYNQRELKPGGPDKITCNHFLLSWQFVYCTNSNCELTTLARLSLPELKLSAQRVQLEKVTKLHCALLHPAVSQPFHGILNKHLKSPPHSCKRIRIGLERVFSIPASIIAPSLKSNSVQLWKTTSIDIDLKLHSFAVSPLSIQ